MGKGSLKFALKKMEKTKRRIRVSEKGEKEGWLWMAEKADQKYKNGSRISSSLDLLYQLQNIMMSLTLCDLTLEVIDNLIYILNGIY